MRGEAAATDVTVVLDRRAPDFDGLGDLPAAFVTPRNVVYQQDGRAVIDYLGEAVSVYDRSAQCLHVQGLGVDLVHEAVYLFVLSRVGEHLERIGRPRLHALGLAGRQGGVAVMLPSGGGKSTLALRALATDGVKLLSEDSPLIDRRGTDASLSAAPRRQSRRCRRIAERRGCGRSSAWSSIPRRCSR